MSARDTGLLGSNLDRIRINGKETVITIQTEGDRVVEANFEYK